jgi:hypothetical protein
MASRITKSHIQSPSNLMVESAQRKGTVKIASNTGFAKQFVFIVSLVDCHLLTAVKKIMIAF